MTTAPASYKILGLCVLLQALCTIASDLTNWLVYYPFEASAPLTIISHMFSHGSWQHLLGNFTLGFFPMVYLERKIGAEKLLNYYVLCGLGSALVNVLMSGPGGMIGSSGAISGMITMALLAYGETRLEQLTGCLFLMVLLLPQIAALPMQELSGVAVWGHVGGALTGMLIASRMPLNPSRMP